jgi:ParB/RepB/Spo0J family partition protein
MTKTALRVVNDDPTNEPQVERELKRVSVDRITRDPDNRQPGDVKSLAASIREEGLLQPILLMPVQGDSKADYMIVFGERRWTAVKELGHKEIDAFVLEMSEADQRLRGFIENYIREDLKPSEQITALAKLASKSGLTQRRLSGVTGISQANISKAVKLSTLPASVLQKLDSAEITKEDALMLTDAATEVGETAIEKLVQESPHGISYRVGRLVDDRREEAAREKIHQDLEKKHKGLRIIDWPDGWTQNGSVRLLSQEGSWNDLFALGITPAQHESEPCHAATINPRAEVLYVCTEPHRHAKGGDSKVTAPRQKADSSKESEQERATRKQQKEDKAARIAKLKELVRVRRLGAQEETRIKELHVVRSADGRQAQDACKLLDLEISKGDFYEGLRVLKEFASRGSTELQQAARAVVFAAGEAATGFGNPEVLMDHYKFLKDHGYVPSALEQARIKEDEKRSKPKAVTVSSKTASALKSKPKSKRTRAKK